MTVAVYGSIWLGLACFVIGEAGKRMKRRAHGSARWALPIWATGAAIAFAHAVLALHFVFDWDHERAVSTAAERAGRIYGAAWRGSLYMNYAFILWWLAEVLWWWRAPTSYLARSSALEWTWRIVAFTMIFNGAVVFASPSGRLIGIPLIGALAFLWFWKISPQP